MRESGKLCQWRTRLGKERATHKGWTHSMATHKGWGANNDWNSDWKLPGSRKLWRPRRRWREDNAGKGLGRRCVERREKWAGVVGMRNTWSIFSIAWQRASASSAQIRWRQNKSGAAGTISNIKDSRSRSPPFICKSRTPQIAANLFNASESSVPSGSCIWIGRKQTRTRAHNTHVPARHVGSPVFLPTPEIKSPSGRQLFCSN